MTWWVLPLNPKFRIIVSLIPTERASVSSHNGFLSFSFRIGVLSCLSVYYLGSSLSPTLQFRVKNIFETRLWKKLNSVWLMVMTVVAKVVVVALVDNDSWSFFFFCLFYIEKPFFWMPLMNVVVFYIYKWFLHFFVLFLVSCSRFFLHFLKVFHFLSFFSFFSSFYLFQLTLCDDLFFLFWILIIIIFSFTTYIL